MTRLMSGAGALAMLAVICGCEGMAPGGYGDMPENEQIAAAQAAIPPMPQTPMPSTPMSMPNGQPRPGAMPQPVIPPAQPPVTGGPSRTTPPPAAPPPSAPTTGGPSQMPKPPAAPAPTPLPPAARGSCTAPSIPIRTEANGAMEIKCGVPPTAAPAGMKCTAPEQLTFLTRSGVSSFQCMK